jgi:hypothetical protein
MTIRDNYFALLVWFDPYPDCLFKECNPAVI